MIILGISAFYHDSAACILKDGEILAAALRCFYETSLDALVLGNCILIKEDQTININPNYKKQYLND